MILLNSTLGQLRSWSNFSRPAPTRQFSCSGICSSASPAFMLIDSWSTWWLTQRPFSVIAFTHNTVFKHDRKWAESCFTCSWCSASCACSSSVAFSTIFNCSCCIFNCSPQSSIFNSECTSSSSSSSSNSCISSSPFPSASSSLLLTGLAAWLPWTTASSREAKLR